MTGGYKQAVSRRQGTSQRPLLGQGGGGGGVLGGGGGASLIGEGGGGS